MKGGSVYTISFRRVHFSVFRYRWSKNGFAGPKIFRVFRETGPKPRRHYAGRIWKRRFHPEKASHVFHPTTPGKFDWTQQSTLILNLRLTKTQAGKSPNYRDVIVFKMASARTRTQSRRFQIPPISEELRFRDGLIWKESLIGEIKLRFQIPRRNVDKASACL